MHPPQFERGQKLCERHRSAISSLAAVADFDAKAVETCPSAYLRLPWIGRIADAHNAEERGSMRERGFEYPSQALIQAMDLLRMAQAKRTEWEIKNPPKK